MDYDGLSADSPIAFLADNAGNPDLGEPRSAEACYGQDFSASF